MDGQLARQPPAIAGWARLGQTWGRLGRQLARAHPPTPHPLWLEYPTNAPHTWTTFMADVSKFNLKVWEWTLSPFNPSPTLIPNPHPQPSASRYCDSKMSVYAVGMFAALIGAACFLLLATFTSMPVSTTHAIVGGVVGVTVVGTSFDCLNWSLSGGLQFSLLCAVPYPPPPLV